MNKEELQALLEQHEKRGLCWVTIGTGDLRELLTAAQPAPAAVPWIGAEILKLDEGTD